MTQHERVRQRLIRRMNGLDRELSQLLRDAEYFNRHRLEPAGEMSIDTESLRVAIDLCRRVRMIAVLDTGPIPPELMDRLLAAVADDCWKTKADG